VGITGLKRQGKSLLLAWMLCFDMVAYGRTVWSTMPVRTPAALLRGGHPLKESLPIDWNSLYMLSGEYEYGTIGLDESIYYDDSRTSLSMRNKLLNTIMNQVGHRNLNVYYTVKTAGWLDRRLQFETDIRIVCTDLGRTPWGRSHHVGQGRVIRLDFFDLSGFFSNHPFHEKYNYRPFSSIIWRTANDFWDAYNTKEVIGIEDLMTKVQVDMKSRVISNKPSYDRGMQEALYNLAASFHSKGNETIPCDTFWTVANSAGIEGDSRQLGRYLKPLGIKRKDKRGGNIYDLSNMVQNS